MSITVRAAAKINLHLGVGAAREDGFHPLDTVYQAISLYDDLQVSLSPAAGAPWDVTVEVAEHIAAQALPAVGDNIVTKAAQALAARHGITVCGRAVVTKEIPIAGGMAGGSADAAAALVALDRLWQLNTPDQDLLAIAATLGSDVPFALVGGTAHGTGRGEQVRSITDAGVWHWVICPSAGKGLSTPTVYRQFDLENPDASATPAPAGRLLAALASGDPHALAAALHNDLQPPAISLRPELGELIDTGESLGALRGLVSGSGPTVLFLAEDQPSSLALAGELAARGHRAMRAFGPVAGAHVLHDDVLRDDVLRDDVLRDDVLQDDVLHDDRARDEEN